MKEFINNEDAAPYKVFHACDNPECNWSPRKNVRGVEIEFDGESFTFRYGDRIAGPYHDIYQLTSEELSEKLGIDPKSALAARLTALQIYEDRELEIKDLVEALGVTVKRDDTNKVVTFLVMLSAFTEDDQINVSFRAESSTGKSYIPLEVSALFPSDRVVKIAYSSPTAFFHERGTLDPDTGEIVVELEKKILIFLDQPHNQLLERLRPLLSHDQKELVYKITDKREKLGLRTKTVKIIGYPAVIFCTGRLALDEQEATRMILLSPEISQEKLREAIYLKILKEADEGTFKEYVESDPRRKALKGRIKKIAELKVRKIIVPEPEKIAERFVASRKTLKPRHSRDAERLMALAKVLALLNYNHRKVEENGDGLTIYASEKDIENAFKIWDEISKPQEYNLSPFVLRVFQEIIVPLAKNRPITDAAQGPTRMEIMRRFLEVFGRPLSRMVWEREIVPSLEAAGLIERDRHPQDHRKTIYIPTSIEELEDEYTPPFRGTYFSGDRSVSGDSLEKYVPQQGGVKQSEHQSLKDPEEDNEPQKYVPQDGGVYYNNESTSPSDTITFTTEGAEGNVCSQCIYWDAWRCVKHPDWTLVTPSATYPKKCEFFKASSSLGGMDNVQEA